MPLDLDARLRPADAARAVGVSKQLINAWRTRGWVKPDDLGRYRLGDVLQVERQKRRSPFSTRNVRSSEVGNGRMVEVG